MNRQWITTAVAVVAAFGVGLWCSLFFGGQHGGVAVVDLDKVAEQLGRKSQMESSIRTVGDALNSNFVQTQQAAVKKLEEIRDGLGESPTQEQAQQFDQLQRRANLELNQYRQQAQAQLGQHRLQLVSAFRDQAKPIAQKVAKEKGLLTIVTPAEVFAFDEAVDITDEVIKLMKAEQPAQPAATSPVQPASARVPAPVTSSTPSSPSAQGAPAQGAQGNPSASSAPASASAAGPAPQPQASAPAASTTR